VRQDQRGAAARLPRELQQILAVSGTDKSRPVNAVE
jgi:hypothetical protein